MTGSTVRRIPRRAVALAILLAGTLGASSPARAYSVLAHEANIDALWESGIRPLLHRRFPEATADDLTEARAFAYGGSVIQDLGYYPFGSHFFSNLLHYVRSGDFVETMIREARDVDEYAFALGALAHYAADNTGHPEAVNRAVALMFPKLRGKYGDVVTYAKSPASHVMVEFSIDVVQAAAGAYVPAAFHAFIGFEVSKPLLERAFREVYGIEMRDVFQFDEDLAIGTYRRAISETIPEITRIAWRDRRDAIAKLTPQIHEEQFVFNLSRADYDRDFGVEYHHPGFFARLLAFLYKLLPKIGPLKPLTFKAPSPEAEQLFLDSFHATRDRYRQALAELRDGRLRLANTDFDTGKPAAHGEYELADETYAKLLDRLAKRKFEGVAPALRRNIDAFYRAAPDRVSGRAERKRLERVHRQLLELNSAASQAQSGASKEE